MQKIKVIKLIIIGLIVLTSVSLSSCTIANSAAFQTETYELQDFSKIIISAIGQVNISQGEKNSLTIVAEPGIINNISYSIADETLYVELKDDMSVVSLNPHLGIQFIISSKSIKSIQNSSTCSITASGLTGDTLHVIQDSVGNITLSNVNYESIDLKLSGGGVVEINGSINEQTVSLIGAVSYNSAKTPSRIINASLFDESQATVWALETLNVETSVNADFQFYGKPQNIYLGLYPENVHALD